MEEEPSSQITTMASSPSPDPLHPSSTSITTISPKQTQPSPPPPSSITNPITTTISPQETHSASKQTSQTNFYQPQTTHSALSSTSSQSLTPLPPSDSTQTEHPSFTPPPSDSTQTEPPSFTPPPSDSTQTKHPSFTPPLSDSTQTEPPPFTPPPSDSTQTEPPSFTPPPSDSTQTEPPSFTPPPSSTTLIPQPSPPPSSSITTTTSPHQTQETDSSLLTQISQTHLSLQTQPAPSSTPPPPPPPSSLSQEITVLENQQAQNPNLMQNQQPQHQNWKQMAKPYAIVILLQFLFAMMNILTKLSMNKGMSNYVFVAYRNITAFVVIAPFAIYRERDRWSEMTLSVFWKILVLSVLGPIMDQDLYFLGMKYSTATVASALCNTLPGMTFVLACVTRRENIDITSKSSQAKILGTIITVLGATVMTLVKGPVLFGTVGANSHSHHYDGFHTVLGFVFILLSTLSSAISNILQTITLSQLDLPLTVTSLICLFGSIEAVVVAVIMNKKPFYSVWLIFDWDIKLLSAIYAGICCSGLGIYLRGQVMQDRGPVFATMFNPLGMILVATSGYLFLNEQQLLGRVIGALIIALGLYCVVWGTNRDYNLRRQENTNAVANP